MSAECSKCGADIVYPPGTWPLGECPACDPLAVTEGEGEGARCGVCGKTCPCESPERCPNAVAAATSSPGERTAGVLLHEDAQAHAKVIREALDVLCDEATLGLDEDAAQDAVVDDCNKGQAALAALLSVLEERPGRSFLLAWQKRALAAEAALEERRRRVDSAEYRVSKLETAFLLAKGSRNRNRARALAAEAALERYRKALVSITRQTEGDVAKTCRFLAEEALSDG